MSDERPCNICDCRPAGSREHLPGVAAANNHPVRITYPVFSQAGSSGLRHEEREEEDGFVVRTICGHCNRRTGGSLGTAYKHFVLKFAASGILDAGQRRTWVSVEAIQPLRVIKQMATMFLAAQPELDKKRWAAIREFVLRRDAKLPQDSLRFYLYRNTGPKGRIVSLGALGALFLQPQIAPAIFCEISWPPLGLVVAPEPHPFFNSFKDVTEWGTRRFRDVESFQFSVPQYRVDSHWPLGFGTPTQANAWIDRIGGLWFASNVAEPTAFGTLVQQLPKPKTAS